MWLRQEIQTLPWSLDLERLNLTLATTRHSFGAGFFIAELNKKIATL